jgi:limonene-1,2-epoxide hydrolase
MASRQRDGGAASPGGQREKTAADATDPAPASVVERFLDRLRTDPEAAADFLAPDAQWMNNGLPAVRGRGRVRRVFRALERIDTGFDVYVHTISVDGGSVMTERTDALKWGPMRVQFWVCGRFDVRDGEIVHWQDYFDYLTTMAAIVRGLLGIVVPAARAKPPPGDWRGGITGAA